MKLNIKSFFFVFVILNLIKVTTNQEKDGGLRGWLKKLVINIPEKDVDGVKMKNITIDNILLGSITTKKENDGINLSINDIGIHMNCSISRTLGNDLTVDIAAQTVYSTIPLKLNKNPNNGLVESVSTKGLKLNINDKNKITISFPGHKTLDNFMKFIIELIKATIFNNILDMVSNMVSELIDNKLTELFHKANDLILNGSEPIPLNVSIQKPVDLRNSSVIDVIGFLLSKFTGANGPLSFNHLFSIISNGTGEIHLHDFYNQSILFNFNISDKDDNFLGNVEFGILDLNLTGLNTWGEFNALIPNQSSPVKLDTNTYLEVLGINLSFSIKVTLEKESGIVTSDAVLYEEAILSTKLINNSLWGQMQLPSYSGKVDNYSNKQCLNLQCIINLLDENGTGINQLNLNESFEYIKLQAGNAGLEEEIDKLINDLVGLFIDSYKNQIPAFINAILNSTLINKINNVTSNYMINTKCEDIKDNEESEIHIPITICAVTGALLLYLFIIIYPYIFGTGCKKGIDENKNESNISNVAYAYITSSVKCLQEFFRSDSEGASLFLNPNINIIWRIGIPFLILLNIAMFISSNSGVGASVYVLLTVGRKVRIPSLFDFGLVNSVTDMWKAGVYPLSFLIAFFSGIWPYLKLIMMLISFITPTSILKKEKRETVLMFLDATGKWSILDSYVMILMLVAFHFDVKFPITGIGVKENVYVDVYVLAAYGFLTLLTGTCFSLGLSHIITHLHRGLDEHPDQNKGEKAESYKSLITFAESKYISKEYFQLIITILLFLTLILVIFGSLFTSFSFHFHGLAGYALGLLDISAQREYSVFDLGLNVPNSYEFPNNKTIRFTQIIYFLTVFVMPISTLIIVIILWLIPFPRKTQKFLYSISEIFNAWSCLDVFVISIIAAVVEIGQFTEFIVGDKCDFINPFIKQYFHETLNGHDTCFEVRAYLQSGCWILFISAITYFIGSMVVMNVCRNALYERLPEEVKQYLKNKNNNKDSILENISSIDSNKDNELKMNS